MPLSLTVLVENTAPEGLKKEHGLSVLVETESTRILFDTGAGNALGPNLDALGLDIDPLDAVILSHGHYDHGGGLPEVRHRLGNLPVHAHPEALTPRFSLHPGRPPKQIGLPENVRHMLKTRLVPTPEAMDVAPGRYVAGKVPRITDVEDTGGPL